MVEGPLIEDGHIATRETPGLGVTLNEDVARENAVDILGFFDCEKRGAHTTSWIAAVELEIHPVGAFKQAYSGYHCPRRTAL